jgi:DNA modification methylase
VAGTPELIAERVRASGNLGITATQLVRSMGADPRSVHESLDRLQRDHKVARVGHGLWVDLNLISDPSGGLGYSAPSGYLQRFSRAAHLPIETYSGDIQFRPNTEEPVHRWWPYVQGFSAGFVRDVIARHGIGVGDTVLDPFAGSGTVPVAARLAGARGIGVELMPISAFVATAKQRWDVNPVSLERAASKLLQAAPRTRPSPLPFLKETQRQFAPGPLDSLRRIRGALDSVAVDPGGVRTLLRLAFARILVDSSRMRRSPCLGYGPKAEVPRGAPYRMFQDAVVRMAADLRGLSLRSAEIGPPGEIMEMDCRSAPLPPGGVDLAITSPPYVNGMDYIMNYKLELAWLGLVDSYAGLRALKERMVACDNLPRAAAARGWADTELRGDRWMAEILRRMRANLAAKSTYRRSDMDAVVASYFSDLRPMLARVFAALKPGGRFVVVNGDSFLAGVYVPGDLLFSRLAQAEGFVPERFEIARIRRSGQRRDLRLHESILTLQKPTH